MASQYFSSQSEFLTNKPQENRLDYSTGENYSGSFIKRICKTFFYILNKFTYTDERTSVMAVAPRPFCMLMYILPCCCGFLRQQGRIRIPHIRLDPPEIFSSMDTINYQASSGLKDTLILAPHEFPENGRLSTQHPETSLRAKKA